MIHSWQPACCSVFLGTNVNYHTVEHRSSSSLHNRRTMRKRLFIRWKNNFGRKCLWCSVSWLNRSSKCKTVRLLNCWQFTVCTHLY